MCSQEFHLLLLAAYKMSDARQRKKLERKRVNGSKWGPTRQIITRERPKVCARPWMGMIFQEATLNIHRSCLVALKGSRFSFALSFAGAELFECLNLFRATALALWWDFFIAELPIWLAAGRKSLSHPRDMSRPAVLQSTPRTENAIKCTIKQ